MSASNLAIYEDDTQAWGLIEADALLTLAKFPDGCVDAIVTDPPYGIGIVGAHWDRASSNEAFERWTRVWAEQCLRLLKPGGHLLAFGAPRTFHRLTSGIEDAGLEIRDVLLWLNGGGIPKSQRLPGGGGTALKPAYEPVLLARVPLTGTVAENLARHGTGTLNIAAAQVASSLAASGAYWPANVALSHSEGCSDGRCSSDCPVRLLDQPPAWALPSRLFYCAKTTRTEREAGCDELPERRADLYTGRSHKPRLVRNTHPTVKPIQLMRWLIRLAVPAGGLVLDPFAGSGTTGIAAISEGRQFLGIERESEYVEVACARLTHWAHQPGEPA